MTDFIFTEEPWEHPPQRAEAVVRDENGTIDVAATQFRYSVRWSTEVRPERFLDAVMQVGGEAGVFDKFTDTYAYPLPGSIAEQIYSGKVHGPEYRTPWRTNREDGSVHLPLSVAKDQRRLWQDCVLLHVDTRDFAFVWEIRPFPDEDGKQSARELARHYGVVAGVMAHAENTEMVGRLYYLTTRRPFTEALRAGITQFLREHWRRDVLTG